jgi:fibronectin-binding autotransporter adhesin
VDVKAGELNVSGTILNTGNNVFDFSGGTIRAGAANFVTGALTVGDANAAVAASYVLTGNGTHGIGALLTVQSDGSVSGNGVIAASTNGTTATAVLNSGLISAGSGQTLRVVGSLTNQSGATLSVTNGGSFIASAASTNAGTVRIGSGSAATFSNGLSSAGALIVDGTLTGATTIASGGVLSGSGTMASAVTIGNGGTLAIGNSPGTMTFEENLTLDLNSTSLFEINGFTAGQFDLAQGGAGTQTVTFGGTLELVFSGGFNTLGSVKIFDFENYSGSFTGGVNSTGLASGYTATFNELDGVVTVVPEPSTYALLALSAAGLAAHIARRRRRH